MTNLIKFSLLITILTISALSQENDYNIEVGKKYKFVLFDDTEIIGTVISVNSSSVVVKESYGGEITIIRENLLYVSRDVTPGKYMFSISLMGGVSMFTEDNNYYYYSGYSSRNTKPGMNLNLSGMFYVSESKAIKLDLGYSFLKGVTADGPVYSYEYPPPVYEGGNMSYYSFKPNLLLGSFNPKNRFLVYGSVGLGIHLTHREESRRTEYYSYDSAYHTYISPAITTTNAVFSLGGGFAYKFTKQLGVHAEIEYNLVTSGEGFLFFAGRGYFPLRAGIIYILF